VNHLMRHRLHGGIEVGDFLGGESDGMWVRRVVTVHGAIPDYTEVDILRGRQTPAFNRRELDQALIHHSASVGS